jgi:hypothetical protein
LPAREGAVTVVVQEIDHVGRMLDDGSRVAVGKAINVAVDIELDYAFTDRISISTSLPYIAAKYTDRNGPPLGLPFPAVDACRCWRSEFADFGFTGRYNLVNINGAFMLTPSVAFGLPSHQYPYVGEAVVGRRLDELRLGFAVGQRLDAIRTIVQAGYAYTIVPRVLNVPNNRSDGAFEGDFAVTRHLSIGGLVSWQRTHGGLRFPYDVIVADVPELQTEFHRMLRDNYLHTGASVSYGRGRWQFSASALLTAAGSNSHDVRVFSMTVGRLFGG